MEYIYEIESSIDFANIIDVLKEELKLKEGKIIYYEDSPDNEIEVEKVLPIDELKDKAMEVFFHQDYFSLIFPNIEINLQEDRIEIVSEVKLVLKGIDVDKINGEKVEDISEIKLNLDNFNLFTL